MVVDSFIDRLLELLVNPSSEWERINNAEETRELPGVQRYLLNRVAPAIFLNVCTYFIGVVFVTGKSHGFPGGADISPVAVFLASVLLAAAYVGIIIVGAMIIRLIATSFDSQADESSSLKLIAFSLYPLLIIGSLHVIPGMRIGTLLGSYGIYLLYMGFPVLLKTPIEKSGGFTLVVSLAIIGMLAIAFSLVNAVSGVGLAFRIGL